MNHRVPLLCLVIFSIAFLAACGRSYDNPPGTTTGTLTVQMVQSPPPAMLAGGTAGTRRERFVRQEEWRRDLELRACSTCGIIQSSHYRLSDRNSLHGTGVQSCGQFLNIPVTITATSVTDNSKSASVHDDRAGR